MFIRSKSSKMIGVFLNVAILAACNGPKDLFSSGYQSAVVLGRVENVVLEESKLKLKARIDTGAGISSIHAENVEIVKGAGLTPDRVSFKIHDSSGRVVKLEREIVEWMRVKRKGVAGYIQRPVVVMDLCLGGKQIEARVNLANRTRFIYPLLVGRNVLKAGDFLIDPAKTFLEHPGCTWRRKK